MLGHSGHPQKRVENNKMHGMFCKLHHYFAVYAGRVMALEEFLCINGGSEREQKQQTMWRVIGLELFMLLLQRPKTCANCRSRA